LTWDSTETAAKFNQTTLGHVSGFVQIDTWHTNRTVRAFFIVALLRFGFRGIEGLTFHKILGTGKGDTFTLNDADPRHWALLSVWVSEAHPSFERRLFIRAMNSIASQHRRLSLLPISARGTWAGTQPFATQTRQQSESKILVITRARIKVRWWRYFYSQVPPVIVDLQKASGLQERFGIGEAPVGLQGTISIWNDNDSIKDFAYRTAAHQDVMDKTLTLKWYSEELFARFEVLRDEDLK